MSVSVSGPKTCLVCGKPLPRGWRDDVHRECAAASRDTTPGPNGNEPSAPKRPETARLHDDIERLVGEGLTKNAIATQLHTSWETITKVCRERGLTPVRGHRGKPITIKARRKPTEPTPPTAIDKVQAMRAKRRAGAEIDALAIEFNCLPSTVRMLCDDMEPSAPDPPDDPATDQVAIEKEPAEPGPASELAAARELVCAREQAYQAKFAELAVAALVDGPPDLSLARLAYEYGYAVGGYRVLAAMAEGAASASPSGEAA
jgi:hypothetical protein